MTTNRRRRAAAISIVGLVVLAVSGAPSATAIAQPTSDLAVSVSANSVAYTNNSVDVTATARNVGPTSARGVVLTVELPSALRSVWAADGCTNDGQTVTCALGELRSGAAASVTVATIAEAMGDATSSARAVSERIDRNPADNVATATTHVYGSPTIEVTDTPDPSPAAGVITYQVVVRNPNDVALPVGGGNAQISADIMVNRLDHAKVKYLSARTGDGQECVIIDDDRTVYEGNSRDAWMCFVALPPGETTVTATVALSDVQYSRRLPQWTSVSSNFTGPRFGAWEIEETTLLPNSIPNI